MKKIILTLFFASMTLLFADGASLYSDRCAVCHGDDGSMSAMRKSRAIAGMDSQQIESDLREYRTGKLNRYGMAGVMRAQVVSFSDEQIKEVAKYISTLKKK